MRVVDPGTIGVGDAVTLLDSPNPDWTIARFFATVTGGAIGDDDLAAIAALDGIAAGWQAKATRLLAKRRPG